MTTPPPPPPYGAPIAYPAVPLSGVRPSVRVWDVVLTIVLLVGDGVLALLMSFFGFFLVMASDPCGAVACNTDLIGLGVLVAVALPWVFLLAAVAVAIVLLVKRRLAFWVPLVGAALIIGSWFIGAFMAAAGVPTS